MEERIAQMLVKIYNLKKQIQKVEKDLTEVLEFWQSDEFLNYVKQTVISKEDYE